MASDEEKKHAYKAFKKRIKLTQLDDASTLTRGNKTSRVAGVSPPPGFPAGIWEELVAEGKLRREGGGTYSLVATL